MDVTSLLEVCIETEAGSQLCFCTGIQLVTNTLQPLSDGNVFKFIRIFKQIIINQLLYKKIFYKLIFIFK